MYFHFANNNGCLKHNEKQTTQKSLILWPGFLLIHCEVVWSYESKLYAKLILNKRTVIILNAKNKDLNLTFSKPNVEPESI